MFDMELGKLKHPSNVEFRAKSRKSKTCSTLSCKSCQEHSPDGVLVFVECATDNPTRTIANVKSYFNKSGGSIVANGSLEFMFNRKSVFEILKTETMNIEEMELELIDAGLRAPEDKQRIALFKLILTILE